MESGRVGKGRILSSRNAAHFLFCLTNVPVKAFPAVRSREVNHFHQLHAGSDDPGAKTPD
jgi:hypothetical protein